MKKIKNYDVSFDSKNVNERFVAFMTIGDSVSRFSKRVAFFRQLVTLKENENFSYRTANLNSGALSFYFHELECLDCHFITRIAEGGRIIYTDDGVAARVLGSTYRMTISPDDLNDLLDDAIEVFFHNARGKVQ